MHSSIPIQILALLILATAMIVVPGCATSAPDRAASPGDSTDADEWTESYFQAMRLNPEDAAQQLQTLLARAPDQRRARTAEFELGRLALAHNDINTARHYFDSIWQKKQDDDLASRALYELGRIQWEHDRNYDNARQTLHRSIVETPPWAGAELAMAYLIRQDRRAGRIDSLTDELGSMGQKVDNDRTGAILFLEQGKLLNDELHRANDALTAFRAAFNRCSDCPATDDALIEMSSIYRSHKMWLPALDALKIVADRQKRSFFIGTYSSHRASDARFKMADIELNHRENLPEATRHFQVFLQHFPGDIRADDAAWHLTQIEKTTGSTRQYHRALRQFLRDYPESRYADTALRELGETT